MFKRKEPDCLSGVRKTSWRTPILIQCFSEWKFFAAVLWPHDVQGRGLRRPDRALWAHISRISSIKANILRPCELSATWCFLPEEWWQQPECVREPLAEQKAGEKRNMCVCLHMCQQQVWFFTAALWTLLMKYIFHTGNAERIFCTLTPPGWPGQEHVTLRRRMRPKQCQEVRTANESFGRSTVTALKLRLRACRAHSHGCCKTLAPGLIKTLITERRRQIAA